MKAKFKWIEDKLWQTDEVKFKYYERSNNNNFDFTYTE